MSRLRRIVVDGNFGDPTSMAEAARRIGADVDHLRQAFMMGRTEHLGHAICDLDEREALAGVDFQKCAPGLSRFLERCQRVRQRTNGSLLATVEVSR
jgi:hypothetical protein